MDTDEERVPLHTVAKGCGRARSRTRAKVGETADGMGTQRHRGLQSVRHGPLGDDGECHPGCDGANVRIARGEGTRRQSIVDRIESIELAARTPTLTTGS